MADSRKAKSTLTRRQLDRALVKQSTDRINKDFALDAMRKVLATWLASVRTQLETLNDSIHDVVAAVDDPDSLLFNLLNSNTLNDARMDVHKATETLSCVYIKDCPLPDPIAEAQIWKDSL